MGSSYCKLLLLSYYSVYTGGLTAAASITPVNLISVLAPANTRVRISSFAARPTPITSFPSLPLSAIVPSSRKSQVLAGSLHHERSEC